MKSISLKLPDSLAAKLAAQARKRHTTKSTIVREALEGYLANNAQKKYLTLFDVAPDLIGSIHGPSDLSYNKKYMEGYGR
jgi:hypothetical protein